MSQLPKNFSPLSLPLPIRFGMRRCVLRLLKQEDASLLLEFFTSHTPDTVRQRYGYAEFIMTPEHASQLAGVDQARDAALAIVEQDNGKLRIVAVGRYTLDADSKGAEIAFVVHENRRTLGMATVLMEALMCIARQRKLERFHAQTSADNFAMLGIFLKMDAYIKLIPGTDAVEVDIPLEPDPARNK